MKTVETITETRKWQSFREPNGQVLNICTNDIEAFGLDVLGTTAIWWVQYRSGNKLERKGDLGQMQAMERALYGALFGKEPD